MPDYFCEVKLRHNDSWSLECMIYFNQMNGDAFVNSIVTYCQLYYFSPSRLERNDNKYTLPHVIYSTLHCICSYLTFFCILQHRVKLFHFFVCCLKIEQLKLLKARAAVERNTRDLEEKLLLTGANRNQVSKVQ